MPLKKGSKVGWFKKRGEYVTLCKNSSNLINEMIQPDSDFLKDVKGLSVDKHALITQLEELFARELRLNDLAMKILRLENDYETE